MTNAANTAFALQLDRELRSEGFTVVSLRPDVSSLSNDDREHVEADKSVAGLLGVIKTLSVKDGGISQTWDTNGPPFK